jgi:hypothetical protein
MKTINFVPSACVEQTNEAGEKIPANFSGSITLRKPTFDERMQLAEESGLDIDDEGKATVTKNRFAILRKMVAFSKQFYETTDLKRVDGSEEYKSFDDLSQDAECADILIEAANRIFESKVTKN